MVILILPSGANGVLAVRPGNLVSKVDLRSRAVVRRQRSTDTVSIQDDCDRRVGFLRDDGVMPTDCAVYWGTESVPFAMLRCTVAWASFTKLLVIRVVSFRTEFVLA